MTAEEIVALVDRTGQVVGSAPRRRVRTENLLHAATAVLLRDSSGRIYVHRRSPEKDWSPSAHDAACGGILLLGEDPEPAARRELAEELGVEDVDLRPVGTALYEDEAVRGYLHAFVATYDGPVRFADGEVVWGDWWTLEELAVHLHDPDWPFVPDTRALLASLGARGIDDYARLDLATPSRR